MRNGAHAGIRPLQALVPGRAGDHDDPTRGLGSRRAVERDVRRCDPASGPRATHDDAQGPWVGHQAEPRGPGRGATAGRRAPEPRAAAQAAASGQGCAARQGQDSIDVEIEEIEELPLPAPTCAALGDEGAAQVVWIADTGSANHLCAENTMPGNVFHDIKPCPNVRLATANGIITPQGQLEVHLPSLGVDAQFLVLKDCPPVLSVGRLVEQHGFQFHWTRNKAWFVTPGGHRHQCQVKNYVPHINISSTSTSTSAVASACPRLSSQDPALPGRAIADGAHRDEGAEEVQPPDAAEGAQHEQAEDQDAPTREARLRLEAKSPEHLLTHLPMNSYCDICQASKLRQKPARRRRGDAEINRRPDYWGDTLLADHVSTSEMGLSIDDDRYGLVMLDLGSGVSDIIAAPSKSAEDTLACIKEFGGTTRTTPRSSRAPPTATAWCT